MRVLVLAIATSFAVAPSASVAQNLDLEAGAGLAHLRLANGAALSARGGFDYFDFLTPAVRLFAVLTLGGDDAVSDGYPLTSGYRAWAALPELRIHTPGHDQVYVSAGAGIGQLLFYQCSKCWEIDARRNDPGLFLRVSAGGKLTIGPVSPGVEVAWMQWGGIRDYDAWGASVVEHHKGQPLASYSLMVTLAF